jgi:ubiquinone/menaquinone biosynthesis C-methylase UbiE
MPKRKPIGSARGKPWYETLFVRDYYDYFYVGGPRGIFTPEQRAQQTEVQVDFIAAQLELPERARVLDLCCGWGRHSVRLAQRGYRVTGLDLSAYHLRLAKEAARAAGVQVEWLRGDMRDVPGRARFDAVINCFTSFGYFETEADDQRVLDGVARALKPGGRFLIDTINHDGLMRVFRDSDCRERPDGGLSIELRRYDAHTGRISVDWIYVERDGKRRKAFHSVRLYTYPELAAMLSKAGLRAVRLWGNWDGSELSMHSTRMIVLAEKAAR